MADTPVPTARPLPPEAGPRRGDLEPDTLIDGRYRLRERLGSGGMADVYAAEDGHLGREVALKMLHRRFARDEQFVERFRREASAAARLQHPHIVNVFDRGEHDGTYYIAMEHLHGRSLKEIVAADGPLPPERAIDLTLQILDGAGFAHRQGVVHRDLKPHNVIVDDGGRAKVTDFGIARAGASEMTETGSIMGTAHYLSPEQAQGQPVSQRSDLYSIGVVLYEMLAGRVPFSGDSAVAIALKHLSEAPPPLEGVHPELARVVMRALEKDPDRRFASAAEFAEALRRAREALDGPPAGAWVAEEEPLEEEERRRRWPWIALALVALALLGAGLWALLGGGGERVPDVVGRQLAEATGTLRREGFDVAVRRRAGDAPVNEVVDQDPDGGREADEGATVTLVVSNGPAARTVPSVRGQREASAVRELTRAGFRVESEERSSGDVPAGRAIRTEPPAGTELPPGRRLRLLVSTGPRRVEVPNVVGLTRPSAESRLDARGFGVDVEEADSDAPAGEVVAQTPDPGTEQVEGTTVTIAVSRGPPEQTEPLPDAGQDDAPEPDPGATVPDVEGSTEGDARRALGRAGFRVEVRERTTADSGDVGIVLAQRPAAGRERDRGSTVVIVVGRAAAPPAALAPGASP